MGEFFKSFRGSVLEDILIRYTLPAVPFVVVVIALLPAGTVFRLFAEGAPATNSLVGFAIGWALSVVVGASFSALGRFLNDSLLDRLPVSWWIALVSKKRNQDAINAMGLDGSDQKHQRYELLRSRLYLWGEFDKGMVLAVLFCTPFLPVITERYFPWVALPPWGWWGIYAILGLLVISLFLNWKRNLRRWELFEGVRDE